MTTSEIIDRLFMLAQARLKIRLGAFEQFKNTVEYTAQGDALKAAACEMPRAWHQGLTMGLPEAAIQIDAHFLRLIDRWANENAPSRAVAPLDGFSLAPAMALAPIHEAAPKKETSHELNRRRYQMCIDAGLPMPDNDYAMLPTGINLLAEKEGISKQAFSKSVKKHIATISQ